MAAQNDFASSSTSGENKAIVTDANRKSSRNDQPSESLAELGKQNVAPFLAKYYPRQYAPLESEDGTPVQRSAEAGYCYRHQPDSNKCRRQADEQSMRQLQQV